MITIRCNWCGEPGNDVVYSVVAIYVRDAQQQNPITEHLHFNCLENWVKYMHGGPDPVWRGQGL